MLIYLGKDIGSKRCFGIVIVETVTAVTIWAADHINTFEQTRRQSQCVI